MSYPGGKGAEGVIQAIINQQPPHTSYVEPFLGSGAVLRSKRPAGISIGLDLDPGAIALYGDGVSRCAIYQQCGLSFLETDALGLESSALIYCDPPYLFSTRARSRRIYRFEMTDVDHRRFLSAVRDLRCMVQISGYWSALYAEVLEGWRLVRFNAMTRGGMREECLWMNYAEPVLLHDYRYLGSDFRERERIARKVGRWKSRIALLPVLERAAVLSAITCSQAASMQPGGIDAGDDRRRRAPAASAVPAVHDRRGRP